MNVAYEALTDSDELLNALSSKQRRLALEFSRKYGAAVFSAFGGELPSVIQRSGDSRAVEQIEGSFLKALSVAIHIEIRDFVRDTYPNTRIDASGGEVTIVRVFTEKLFVARMLGQLRTVLHRKLLSTVSREPDKVFFGQATRFSVNYRRRGVSGTEMSDGIDS